VAIETATPQLLVAQKQPSVSVNKTYPQSVVKEITPETITVQFGDEKPKKFPFSVVLAAGGIPKDPRPTGQPGPSYRVLENSMYRRSDVKVGDWVYITYAVLDGTEVCDHIWIVKRPGGLVPPLPEGVKEVGKIPYHERKNAYWDLVDNGNAYPEHFGPHRKYPLAPMPRAVPPKPAPKL
jgi:hypothetical protein